jgi:hypothetical protein
MARSNIKRVTLNIPADLLENAEKVTGKGITGTVIEGLEILARRRAYTKALALRGNLDLSIDVEASRERNRR